MEALQATRGSDSVATLSLVNIPIPSVKPGFALVKIAFSAIQPSDKLNAKGMFPLTTFPRIPGRDYSGEVVAVGDSPSLAKWVGKQVYGTGDSSLGFTIDGPHAQFCLVPEAMLVEKPQGLSLAQAGALGVPFSTALRCLTKTRAGPDDTVLVLGASGAVGSAAVKIAKALGCKRVLGATRRASDAPDVLLGESGPKGTVKEQISSLTSGKGVDVIVDTVGDIALMATAQEQLAQKGRYTWIAAPRGGASTKLEFDIFLSYRKEIELIGCNSAARSSAEVAEELKVLKDLFDSGKLTPVDEDDIQKVDLSEAIQKGFNEKGLRKHVIIKMES